MSAPKFERGDSLMWTHAKDESKYHEPVTVLLRPLQIHRMWVPSMGGWKGTHKMRDTTFYICRVLVDGDVVILDENVLVDGGSHE